MWENAGQCIQQDWISQCEVDPVCPVCVDECLVTILSGQEYKVTKNQHVPDGSDDSANDSSDDYSDMLYDVVDSEEENEDEENEDEEQEQDEENDDYAEIEEPAEPVDIAPRVFFGAKYLNTIES